MQVFVVTLPRSFSVLHPKSTKAVYDRILDLRIATPQIIINYGLFLEEHNYFEESFKVSWSYILPGSCGSRELPV